MVKDALIEALVYAGVDTIIEVFVHQVVPAYKRWKERARAANRPGA